MRLNTKACSICGKSEGEVGLIACPNLVFVCDNCGFEIFARLCASDCGTPLLRAAFLIFKVVAWPEYYFYRIFMPSKLRWHPPRPLRPGDPPVPH